MSLMPKWPAGPPSWVWRSLSAVGQVTKQRMLRAQS
jgi:hypothetical protein